MLVVPGRRGTTMGLIGGGRGMFSAGYGVWYWIRRKRVGAWVVSSNDFLLECAIYVLRWVNNNNPGIKFEGEREKKKETLREKDSNSLFLCLLINFQFYNRFCFSSPFRIFREESINKLLFEKTCYRAFASECESM